MATTTTPTWDDLMKPLAADPLWPHLRRAATLILEDEHQAIENQILRETGEEVIFGISSSDANHVIYGVAIQLHSEGKEPTAETVLRRLVDSL